MQTHLLGYARVSTKKQSTDAQHDALIAAGVAHERIYTDHGISGARADRPALVSLLDYARPGDTIVVTALDRLGRSLSHMVKTITEPRSTGGCGVLSGS